MSHEISQLRNALKEIYALVRWGKADGERTIAAIDSADPIRLRKVYIDPMADPMKLMRLRDYWEGWAAASDFIRFCIEDEVKSLGLRLDPLPVRDLKVVVDNTRPRSNGANPIEHNSKGA